MFWPRLFIILLTSYVAFGQSFSIGVKGGGQLTDDISGTYSPRSESKRYTVGPMLELELPHPFSLEVDALYRRAGYRTSFAAAGGVGGFSDRERANSWEIPVLLKYKVPVRTLKPYTIAGFVPRSMNGYIDRDSFALIKVNPDQFAYRTDHFSTNWSSSVGVLVGGGVQLRFGALMLSPEVRYTYWTSTPIDVGLSNGYSLQSAQNQADILVGVSWKIR